MRTTICRVVPLAAVFLLAASPAFAGALDDAAAAGGRLFASTELGTNGKSCSTCHGDGSVFAGREPFPKEALGGVRTLDQAIQVCITNALAGRALAWDDRRITDLAVHLSRIYGRPAP